MKKTTTIKTNLILVLVLFIRIASAQQPTFQWVSGITNLTNGITRDIATDPSGNSYIFGTFGPYADFDPGPATYTLSHSGGNFDFFILKLDATGAFVWVKSFAPGTNGGGDPVAITLDPSGNIYLLGTITAYLPTDMDPGPGTFTLQTNSPPKPDTYITKLDNNGGFLWSKKINSLNSSADQFPIDIAADASGVYFNSRFYGGVDLDPGTAVLTSSVSNQSSYHVKLDASGNFVWGNRLSYNINDYVQCGKFALDGTGNLYSCGTFSGTLNPDLSGATTSNTLSSSSVKSYVIKVTTAGSFNFIKTYEGLAHFTGVDNIGNIYTAGSFTGTPDFDPGVGTATLTSLSNSYVDLFINKLDASGNFVWVRGYTGNFSKYFSDLCIDVNNNPYLAGTFVGSIDLNPTPAVSSFSTPNSFSDAFITKLDANGSFSWANVYSSLGSDESWGMRIDNSTNIYMCGMLKGLINFNPPATTNTLTGSSTGFVLKLNNAPSTTGIKKNNQSQNNLSVYPNPSNGILQLTSDIVISKISVTDALGKEMQLPVPINLKNKNIELNLKHLSDGIYFISVFGDEGVLTQKIIIDK